MIKNKVFLFALWSPNTQHKDKESNLSDKNRQIYPHKETVKTVKS